MLQHGWTLRTFSSVQFSSVAQSCPSSQGYGFSCGHVWMWELDCEESWAGAFELWCWRLESPLDCKEIQPVHSKGGQPCRFLWKEWCSSWNSSTLATACEELTHWKRLWCWDGLRAGGEGDDRGWDGWMASLTRWTWVWVNSRSWWWTGRPGMLWFTGLQLYTTWNRTVTKGQTQYGSSYMRYPE